jgi:hypothetical protein
LPSDAEVRAQRIEQVVVGDGWDGKGTTPALPVQELVNDP